MDASLPAQDPTASASSKAYDPRLDSLRGLAALAIIPFHWFVFPIGWMGVQVFFVLSGMLITQSLLASRTRLRSLRPYLLNFIEKRALRLFPAYYGFLLVLGASFLALHWPPQFGREIPYLVSYTSNIHRMFKSPENPDVLSHLWTLSVEWQFYLLWPFLVWSFRGHGLIRVALLMTFLVPVLREATIFIAQSIPGMDVVRFGAYAPLTHWDAFALGALLAYSRFQAALSKTRVWSSVLAVFILGGALEILFSQKLMLWKELGYPAELPLPHQQVWGYSLINLLAACLIALTAAKSRITFFADWHFLQYLGKISYGIYLYHFPLINLGGLLLGRHNAQRFYGYGLPMLLGIIVVDIVLAHFSYRYFESWFLRKKASLDRKATPPSARTWDAPSPLPRTE